MKTVITIGRQFGSGGKEIGIRVAKEMGIPFYDKELLQEAAKKSGLCEKIIEQFDERPKSLLYSIAMDSYMFSLPGSGAGESLEQQVYLATFNTIQRIAAEGPCVIIGRCADYALANNPDRMSIFIHAPMEDRVRRVAERQDITLERARALIAQEAIVRQAQERAQEVTSQAQIKARELPEIDDFQLLRDRAAGDCLVLGGCLFEEVDRQLRWRACHPKTDSQSGSRRGTAQGLVFFSVEGGMEAAECLRRTA